jgi:hypothetical protein
MYSHTYEDDSYGSLLAIRLCRLFRFSRAQMAQLAADLDISSEVAEQLHQHAGVQAQ